MRPGQSLFNVGSTAPVSSRSTEPQMATKEEIVGKVRELISQSLGVSSDEIVGDASFIDDLGADSLDIVEMVMLIEKEFDIEIPDEDAEKISTVQHAVDYINDHLGA
jgi:acyl carrier protein